MPEVQPKIGLRFALAVLLIAIIGIPLLKAGAAQPWVPERVRNWFMAV